jgi:hypothetical protein
MYYRGEGTAQDYVEAYKWFSIAAGGGGYLDTRGNVPVRSTQPDDAIFSPVR